MTRLLMIVGGLAVLILLAGVAVAGYVAVSWDREYDAPLPDVDVSTDPDVLARGEYLVYGPAHCVECHGTPDALAQLAAGVKVPLSGGLPLALGPLGVAYAPNLTPDPDTGIGRYSDALIARMMRWNVRPNGRTALDPLMPFGDLSDEDLLAVISFLRTQPPVRNAVPANNWTTMGKLVRSLAGVFKPRTGIDPTPTAPPQAPTVERGEYLARSVANCVGCHTPRDEMTFDAIGPDFSGGLEMEPIPLPGADPSVWFVSPNLTPNPEASLVKFPDRDTFIARFKVGGRQHAGSPMPWEAFAQMSTEDLGALYEFLHSLDPADGPTGDPTFVRSE